MVRDLITLPLRVAATTTRVGVDVALAAFAFGFAVTERLIELAAQAEQPAQGARWSVEFVAVPSERARTESAEPATEAADTPEPLEPIEAVDLAAEATELIELAAELPELVEIPPESTTSEPAVVKSVADAGAQNGAGASVQVDEPWDGYAGMNAHDVIHHLTGASAEEAAVVDLYEHAHRNRKTVLAAAERRLNGAGIAS